jgi:hypothetical protein
MRNLWIVLALSICVVFTACGGEGGGEGGGGGSMKPTVVGTWQMDLDAVMAALNAEAEKNPEAGMMIKMLEPMLKSMKAEVKFDDDGTFTGTMTMKDPMSGEEKTQVGKGTWKLEGDKLSITTLEEDGKKKDTPDTEVATFEDGVIKIKGEEDAPFSIVLKRK